MANKTVIITEVVGVKEVVGKLRRYRGNLGRHLERGLVRAGTMVLRESKKYVPVQTGRLAAAARIRKLGSGLTTIVEVGYVGVEYGAYVHEIPNPPHAHGKEFNLKHIDEIMRAGKWYWSGLGTRRKKFKPYGKAGTAAGGMFPRGELQQYKFLERPLRENRMKIIQILQQEAMKAHK